MLVTTKEFSWIAHTERSPTAAHFSPKLSLEQTFQWYLIIINESLAWLQPFCAINRDFYPQVVKHRVSGFPGGAPGLSDFNLETLFRQGAAQRLFIAIMLQEKDPPRVPALAQWVNDPACLCGGAGWCTGFRILRCCSYGVGHSSCSDAIPALGTSMCRKWGWERKEGILPSSPQAILGVARSPRPVSRQEPK